MKFSYEVDILSISYLNSHNVHKISDYCRNFTKTLLKLFGDITKGNTFNTKNENSGNNYYDNGIYTTTLSSLHSSSSCKILALINHSLG